MPKKKKNTSPAKDNLRLSPEQRLCPKFDNVSMANYTVASRKKMGFRVLDNTAEENIR